MLLTSVISVGMACLKLEMVGVSISDDDGLETLEEKDVEAEDDEVQDESEEADRILGEASRAWSAEPLKSRWEGKVGSAEAAAR